MSDHLVQRVVPAHVFAKRQETSVAAEEAGRVQASGRVEQRLGSVQGLRQLPYDLARH